MEIPQSLFLVVNRFVLMLIYAFLCLFIEMHKYVEYKLLLLTETN